MCFSIYSYILFIYLFIRHYLSDSISPLIHYSSCINLYTCIILSWGLPFSVASQRHECVMHGFSQSESHHTPAWSRWIHYNDVIMSAMASQINGFFIVCSSVGSGADQRKYHSSASLAFVRGICRWPVISPHKGPITRKMFPFDVVIMTCLRWLQDYTLAISSQWPDLL